MILKKVSQHIIFIDEENAFINTENLPVEPKCVIVEDSNAGYEFF